MTILTSNQGYSVNLPPNPPDVPRQRNVSRTPDLAPIPFLAELVSVDVCSELVRGEKEAELLVAEVVFPFRR